MKTVYVETSILSYLTARPTRDLLVTARQQMTREWWDTRRAGFEVFVSPLVDQEARRGDPEAARRRLEAFGGLPLLEIVEEAYDLAAALLAIGALPSSAKDDATHIALAAVHGIDYLLTWNCRHIDNAETKPIVRSVCVTRGYVCPEICTPEELMGDQHED
ncbi:MAG: type II toxin-antitoxin system VapC family toxin [bacterium]